LRGDKRFWSPIAISSGLVILFFGISYTAANLIIRWVDIGFGIALLSIGFYTSPLRESKRKNQKNLNREASSEIQLTDAEYKSYLIEEKKTLVSSLREQARSFDRYILTLAGGTFGLSLVIIKTLAPQPLAHTMHFLVGAWVAFGTSILLTLVSFLLSQKACLRNIETIDATLSGANPGEEYKSGNIFTKLTEIFNWLSMSSFIVGVILLVIFGISNLQVVRGV